MNTVGKLAYGIWQDLDSPTTPSVTFISGWIGAERGVGQLNTLLNLEIIVDEDGVHAGELFVIGDCSGVYEVGDFYPILGNTEKAIYTELYKVDYYQKKVRDSLAGILEGGDSLSTDWTSLTEGDTIIRRVNKNEVAKTYRNMSKDSRAYLDNLVSDYNRNTSMPNQVTFED